MVALNQQIGFKGFQSVADRPQSAIIMPKTLSLSS
jgi:hypothetical protein